MSSHTFAYMNILTHTYARTVKHTTHKHTHTHTHTHRAHFYVCFSPARRMSSRTFAYMNIHTHTYVRTAHIMLTFLFVLALRDAWAPIYLFSLHNVYVFLYVCMQRSCFVCMKTTLICFRYARKMFQVCTQNVSGMHAKCMCCVYACNIHVLYTRRIIGNISCMYALDMYVLCVCIRCSYGKYINVRSIFVLNVCTEKSRLFSQNICVSSRRKCMHVCYICMCLQNMRNLCIYSTPVCMCAHNVCIGNKDIPLFSTSFSLVCLCGAIFPWLFRSFLSFFLPDPRVYRGVASRLSSECGRPPLSCSLDEPASWPSSSPFFMLWIICPAIIPNSTPARNTCGAPPRSLKFLCCSPQREVRCHATCRTLSEHGVVALCELVMVRKAGAWALLNFDRDLLLRTGSHRSVHALWEWELHSESIRCAGAWKLVPSGARRNFSPQKWRHVRAPMPAGKEWSSPALCIQNKSARFKFNDGRFPPKSTTEEKQNLSLSVCRDFHHPVTTYGCLGQGSHRVCGGRITRCCGVSVWTAWQHQRQRRRMWVEMNVTSMACYSVPFWLHPR